MINKQQQFGCPHPRCNDSVKTIIFYTFLFLFSKHFLLCLSSNIVEAFPCHALSSSIGKSPCRFLKSISNKSSAVAEMADHGHNRHGPKRGRLLCPFRGGAGSLSNTMWPGPRSTSVPNGVFIQPFGHNRHGPKTGSCAPFRGRSCNPSNTTSPGPRFTSVPSGIMIHPSCCLNALNTACSAKQNYVANPH